MNRLSVVVQGIGDNVLAIDFGAVGGVGVVQDCRNPLRCAFAVLVFGGLLFIGRRVELREKGVFLHGIAQVGFPRLP